MVSWRTSRPLSYSWANPALKSIALAAEATRVTNSEMVSSPPPTSGRAQRRLALSSPPAPTSPLSTPPPRKPDGTAVESARRLARSLLGGGAVTLAGVVEELPGDASAVDDGSGMAGQSPTTPLTVVTIGVQCAGEVVGHPAPGHGKEDDVVGANDDGRTVVGAVATLRTVALAHETVAVTASTSAATPWLRLTHPSTFTLPPRPGCG